MDEGVAQWEQQSGKERMKRVARALYDQNGLLTVSDMMDLDVRTMKDPTQVYTFPALTKDVGNKAVVSLNLNHLVNTYYIEAFSMIGFLMESFGAQDFAAFCRELRDGKSVEEALRSTYSGLQTMKDFEDQWKVYLEEQ